VNPIPPITGQNCLEDVIFTLGTTAYSQMSTVDAAEMVNVVLTVNLLMVIL
jgi:hypothetical protein